MGVGIQADGDLHGERPGVLHGGRDRGQRRSGDLAGPLGDQTEHVGAPAAGHEAVGDLRVRLEPALPQPGVLIEAGVVDGDAGRHRQRRENRLVVLVELRAAPLLGEVQVAEDLVAHPDGHAEEAVHRWMVVREPV